MPAYDDVGFTPPAPIARVVLRHPDSAAVAADIPLLIDSGADVTLLPKSAISAPGILCSGTKYDLVAFNGTTIAAEAVCADLLFLNKRFRGQFLVVEAEIGVLGRDVLSNVRVLLDGPGSRWDEWRSGT